MGKRTAPSFSDGVPAFLAAAGLAALMPVAYRLYRANLGFDAESTALLGAAFLAGAAVSSMVAGGRRIDSRLAVWGAPLFSIVFPLLLRVGSGAAGQVAALAACFAAGVVMMRFSPLSASRGGAGPAAIAFGLAAGLAAAHEMLPVAGDLRTALAGTAFLFAASAWAALRPASASPESPGAPAGRATSPAGAMRPALAAIAAAAVAAWWVGGLRLLDLLIAPTLRGALLSAACAAFAIGAGALAGKLLRKGSAGGIIAPAALASAAGCAVLALHGKLPWLFIDLVGERSFDFHRVTAARLAVAGIVELPVLFFAGALASALHRAGGPPRATRIALFGGWIAVTVAAPYAVTAVGIRGLLLASVLLFLAVPLVLLAWGAARRGSVRWVAAALVAAAMVVVAFNPPFWRTAVLNSGPAIYTNIYQPLDREEFENRYTVFPTFYEEGRNATIFAFDVPGRMQLRVDGSEEAGDAERQALEKMLGRLPLLFRPEAKEALILGAGHGIAAGALLQPHVSRLTLVEPEWARYLATRHFGRANHDYWTDERLNVVRADPLRYLSATDERFDLVVASPRDLWGRKSAHLATARFFEQARRRLADGGIFEFLVPLNGVHESHIRAVLAAARTVFPHVAGFHASRHNGLIVLGSDEPLALRVDYAFPRWSDPEFSGDFDAASVETLGHLVSFARFDGRALDRWLARGAPDGDRRSAVEFGAEETMTDLGGRNYFAMIKAIPFDVNKILEYGGMNGPERAEFDFDAARAFRGNDQVDSGYPFAEEAHRLAPDSRSAMMFAWYVSARDDDPDRSADILAGALEKDPDNVLLIRTAGDELYRARRFDECVDLMTRAIGLQGIEESWCYLLRGKARLFAGGQDQAALDDLLEAKELNRLMDGRGDYNYYIGLAYKKMSRLEESNWYLARAVGQNEGHVNAKYTYGENKLLLGEIDRSIFQERFVVPFNRARADSLYDLASDNLFDPKRSDEVERDLILILNTTPKHFGAYILLAEYYMRLGRKGKEGAVIGRMVAQFDASDECLARIERYAFRTGGREKWEWCRKIIREVTG